MPNKHQIQKDFNTKKKEWKEAIKVEEANRKIAENREREAKACKNAESYLGEER